MISCADHQVRRCLVRPQVLILKQLGFWSVEPMQRVFVCWQRWLIVMHNYESFGAYARRNLRSRP